MSSSTAKSMVDDEHVSRRNLALITALPWIKNVAKGLYFRVRFTGVSLEDCISSATLGYIESYDSSEDASSLVFKGAAYFRMKGKVLKTAFSVSDVAAQCSAAYERRRERLQSILADPSAISISGFEQLVLGSALGHLLDEQVTIEYLSSDDQSPYQQYEDLQFARIVSAALSRLSPSFRTVISLHYFHGLTFSDIASSLAISRARVSQLHKRGLEHLLTLIADVQHQEEF